MNSKFREIACKAGFSMSQAYSAEVTDFSDLLLTEVFNALRKNKANLTVEQWFDAWCEIKKHFGIEV